jgi:DNA-binding response OmpR family regulator
LNILLGVSDKDNSARLYRELHAGGINAFMTWDFKEVFHEAALTKYSAVVLDPGVSAWKTGLGVARLIREDNWQLPIILLVDPCDKFPRKLAWQYRCDNLCSRYIDTSELGEIIRARAERRPPDRYSGLTMKTRYEEIDLDRDHYVVCRGSIAVTLDPRCFNLLAYLFAHMNERITPQMLVNDVLHKSFNGSLKELDQTVARLESQLRKLGVSLIHRTESISLAEMDFIKVPLKILEDDSEERAILSSAQQILAGKQRTAPINATGSSDEFRDVDEITIADSSIGIPDLLYHRKNTNAEEQLETRLSSLANAPVRADLKRTHILSPFIKRSERDQNEVTLAVSLDDSFPN